ncbi:MAG: PGPGW domain-containing protein [Acidimicrobiales bacterium]
MAPAPREVLTFLVRSSKRVAVTVVGGVLVLIGLAMFVLPGPGILVVVLGFAILGTEYAWAAAALERTKGMAAKAATIAKSTASGAAHTVGKSVKRPFRR